MYVAHFFDNLYPGNPVEKIKIFQTEREGWNFVAKQLKEHRNYIEVIRKKIEKEKSLGDLEIEMLLEVMDDPYLFEKVFRGHYAHLPEVCRIFRDEHEWQEEYFSFGVREQKIATPRKEKDLFKMIGIDEQTFDSSHTLDDYISTKIDQHIENMAYKDREQFFCTINDYGINYFLRDEKIEGITHLSMLKRWMDVIYPDQKDQDES